MQVRQKPWTKPDCWLLSLTVRLTAMNTSWQTPMLEEQASIQEQLFWSSVFFQTVIRTSSSFLDYSIQLSLALITSEGSSIS
jgi:hypothetical protein